MLICGKQGKHSPSDSPYIRIFLQLCRHFVYGADGRIYINLEIIKIKFTYLSIIREL